MIEFLFEHLITHLEHLVFPLSEALASVEVKVVLGIVGVLLPQSNFQKKHLCLITSEIYSRYSLELFC